MVANPISNTGIFAELVHPNFFGECGSGNPHRSDSDCR